MLLSLLLASLSFGQSTDTVKETLRLDNIAVSVRELQSGKPTITGVPYFVKGASVGSTGITFDDDSVLTSANNLGSFLQFVSSSTSAPFAPVHSVIPADDTIPQINEGMQVLVATVTPISASSSLDIEAIVQYGESSNNCNTGALCLFQGSTADALACASVGTNGTPFGPAVLRYKTSSASTNLRNYSIRIGCEVADTIEVNRIGNALRYGNTLTSSLTVKEIR